MRISALVPLLALAACNDVGDLGKPSRPLLGDEPQWVRRKADEALQQERWVDAWNLEKEAGGDRSRVEEVALQALAHEVSDSRDMFQRIREKFGGLSEGAKARVKALTDKAVADRDWRHATEMQVLAADDAPAFKGAWDVFLVTPQGEALGILQRIQKARDEWDEAQKKKKAEK